jgi:hypothetical protein
MKKFYLYLLFFIGGYVHLIQAQISHGGSPLFLNNSSLRNSYSLEYIEMPSFNSDSVKRLDELNKGNMRTSFQFAHKFYTHIEKGKQGNIQLLSDGTKVWQVGVRSKDAYSINLLFTKFRLPEGGKLFIYNADHTHIVGSFDHRNNSSENILPIQPVAGSDLIIEYSEPTDAAFEGELIIGEVNHDYLGILDLRLEPKVDQSGNYLCMPDALCSAVDEEIIRSTVLLIINGISSCTGSLVNNTQNDGTPYLLTAVHCLNPEVEHGIYKEMDYYIERSGTVIAFFNYNRPVCQTEMKATEEMSLAVTTPRVIIERKDVALLEFIEKPLVHYNAYYAGWNVNEQVGVDPPYINLHHPNGAVKRYGQTTHTLELNTPWSIFDPASHWKVKAWTTGSTWPGSSGSPLFKDNLIIGTLTGGGSKCTGSNPNGVSDYFTALYKSWEQTDPNNQLKTYLDLANTGKKQQEGFDPHANNPLIRVSNADYNKGDKLANTSRGNGFLFGNNDVSTIEEFAEEFNLEKSSEILGVYLLIPTMPYAYTSGVEIEIYDGNESPQNRLKTQSFHPRFLDYSGNQFQQKEVTTESVPIESFVVFDEPVPVGKKFFVAYKITLDPSNSKRFSIYNTEFASSETANTAWLKDGQQWVKASDYTPQTIKTSLALQPLIRFTNDSSTAEITNNSKKVYYDRLTNQLILTFEPENPGKIFIYSISGQLIEQILFSKGEKSFRLSRPLNKGSVKIVKISDKKAVFSEKLFIN